MVKTVCNVHDSRGKCKNMAGNPDGSEETVKDPSVTPVDTGKPESKGSGTSAQIFLVRFVKTL